MEPFFRNKCWKCSSKKGQAVEVVLGVRTSAASPRAPRATERSRPLTGLPKSSASPSSSSGAGISAEAEGGTEGISSQRQVPSAAAVEVAVQAPEAQQGSLLVPRRSWVKGALRFDAATPASSAPCCYATLGCAVLCRAPPGCQSSGELRVVRNRLMHILTGNGPSSVVYIMSLALVAPVFWDVHKGSRIIVDEAMTTAAAAASAVIEEAGLGASRAVQVAGYALAVASLLVCSFALWHLGRRLLNRLAHMSHGNTALIQLVDSEAVYEITGSRSGKTHRVWVDLKLCAAACGCRAFLTEGVCGHADAALAAAKAAGLCGSSATAGRTSAASQEGADSLLSRAALRGRDALRDIADPSPCFEGLAAKSRVITEGGCFSGLRGRNRDPPPAVQDAQAAVPEGTPLKAAQAGRRNRSAPKKVAEPEVLHGERCIEVVQALLASATAGSTLHVRAYSFDGPGYVEAIELSLKNGASPTPGRPLAVQPH